MGLHETENLHHSEGSNQQNERQPAKWNKVFATHIYDKGVVSKKYKELLQLNSKQNKTKKQIILIFKCAKELNRHFFKEGIQMANKYLKRCSTSLIFRQMEIKTKIRYHLSPVGMAIIKKSCTDKDIEKREPLDTVGENVIWSSYYEKQYGDFLKK